MCVLAGTAFPLEVGDKAPEFEAKTQTGEDWTSADLVGQKNLIVYFYPAAMTGGCTKQACAYRDSQEALAELDAVVVGVSGDRPDGLALFEKAENLNFTLLADFDGEVAKAFGVPVRGGGKIEREVEGKTHTLERGVSAARWTFVIGKDGTVIHKNDKVKAAADCGEVVEVLKKTSGR